MATSILKQIRISTDQKDLTFHLNEQGNIFIHEGEGTDITDFWMEVPFEDFVEVYNFLTQLKRDDNV